MYDFADPDNPDTIRIPFIFVPHGHPLPTEWLRDHPGAFRVPAVMVERGAGGEEEPQLALDWGAAADVVGDSSDTSNPIQRAQFLTRTIPGAVPMPGNKPLPRFNWTPEYTDTALNFLLRLLVGPLALPPPSAPTERADGPMEANPRPDRNAGLPPPLRAYTYRARKSAEAADAATKEALDQSDQRVHHLVNAAAAQAFPDLLAAAARTGWFIDEPANVITLPANETARAHLAARGILLPVHDSGHPIWNRDVTRSLAILRKSAFDTFGSQDSEAKDLFIRWRLEVIQGLLRARIPTLIRVVENSSGSPHPPGNG